MLIIEYLNKKCSTQIINDLWYNPILVSSIVWLCCCLVAKSCLTHCNPIDCSPPGSSVHGVFQARILEWVAISFARRFSRPRDGTSVSCLGRWILHCWATREAHSMACKHTKKSKMYMCMYIYISLKFPKWCTKLLKVAISRILELGGGFCWSLYIPSYCFNFLTWVFITFIINFQFIQKIFFSILVSEPIPRLVLLCHMHRRPILFAVWLKPCDYFWPMSH